MGAFHGVCRGGGGAPIVRPPHWAFAGVERTSKYFLENWLCNETRPKLEIDGRLGPIWPKLASGCPVSRAHLQAGSACSGSELLVEVAVQRVQVLQVDDPGRSSSRSAAR